MKMCKIDIDIVPTKKVIKIKRSRKTVFDNVSVTKLYTSTKHIEIYQKLTILGSLFFAKKDILAERFNVSSFNTLCCY